MQPAALNGSAVAKCGDARRFLFLQLSSGLEVAECPRPGVLMHDVLESAGCPLSRALMSWVTNVLMKFKAAIDHLCEPAPAETISKGAGGALNPSLLLTCESSVVWWQEY
jgi:hypothetical protein